MRNLNCTLHIFWLFLLLKFIDAITFSYLASVQSYIIPQNVYEVNIQAYGGLGGKGFVSGAIGGYGGYISCNVNVTAGQTLYILTGGTGVSNGGGGQVSGGYNGGKFNFWFHPCVGEFRIHLGGLGVSSFSAGAGGLFYYFF